MGARNKALEEEEQSMKSTVGGEGKVWFRLGYSGRTTIHLVEKSTRHSKAQRCIFVWKLEDVRTEKDDE